jgi:hypothetical protein
MALLSVWWGHPLECSRGKIEFQDKYFDSRPVRTGDRILDEALDLMDRGEALERSIWGNLCQKDKHLKASVARRMMKRAFSARRTQNSWVFTATEIPRRRTSARDRMRARVYMGGLEPSPTNRTLFLRGVVHACNSGANYSKTAAGRHAVEISQCNPEGSQWAKRSLEIPSRDSMAIQCAVMNAVIATR